MKKIFILIFIILWFNKSNASIQTWFSIINQNGNNYKFQIMSWIGQGAGLNCPNLYPTPVQLSADTIYIRQLYDLTGVWQSFGCMATDTVDFVNIYPTANYINLSIGFYIENTITQNIDTLWNYHDTTYQVNPLSVQDNNQEKRNYYIYPNPNNGSFTVNGIQTGSPIELTMYDAIGKLVYSDKTLTTPTQVSLPNLQAGIYVLHLQDSSKSESQREKIILR